MKGYAKHMMQLLERWIKLYANPMSVNLAMVIWNLKMFQYIWNVLLLIIFSITRYFQRLDFL